MLVHNQAEPASFQQQLPASPAGSQRIAVAIHASHRHKPPARCRISPSMKLRNHRTLSTKRQSIRRILHIATHHNLPTPQFISIINHRFCPVPLSRHLNPNIIHSPSVIHPLRFLLHPPYHQPCRPHIQPRIWRMGPLRHLPSPLIKLPPINTHRRKASLLTGCFSFLQISFQSSSAETTSIRASSGIRYPAFKIFHPVLINLATTLA